jgi:hypothetical protein
VEVEDAVPLRVARVSTNDHWPLIYLPKAAVETLGLGRGRRVLILLDKRRGALILKPVLEEEAR